MDIKQEALKIKEEVIQFRRDLHRCPETAFLEKKTMAYVRKHLDEWKISYEMLQPTGCIAKIGRGKEAVALRADMDALRVKEETNLPFASEHEGYMHACGHDGHTAVLLATAKILKKHEEELNHRVLLIFQPAEEIAAGSKMVLKTGKLDGITGIFGLHIFSGIAAGKVSLEAGPRMAATNWFSIHVKGKSGHAGKPHECVDAIIIASSLVMNLQTIISRSLNPLENAVLTIGKMQAGTARNVVAGDAVLEGTVRTFSKESEQKIQKRMKEMIAAQAQMYGADITFNFEPASHPALVNSEIVVQKVKKKADAVFEANEWTHVPAMMLGEDFSNYLEEYPGCFAFIGGGGRYPNHHSQFDFDESALVQGVKMMLIFALV
ncbi:M20 metallopeptidase family protein [Anaerostipes sp.]|uniref:M20 metallopeptidase family protein n=1 Tax=Anaerostipes sp. TaxID=1872530 RepID=UPI003FF117D3